MKIVFLNAWNGTMPDDLGKFIKEQSVDTDIFCFQEAYKRMEFLCKGWLPGYTSISAYKYVGPKDDFSQATYVRPGITIVSSSPVLSERTGTGLGIYAEVESGGSAIHVCNFHGVSRPVDKFDAPTRIDQSQGLIDLFKDKMGPKIIGGDFNLMPETKSVRMLEEAGYRNLIGDFKVPTTRNRVAWNMYPESKQYYADYVFTSPDVDVKHFSVPENEISDHLPMILEFSVRT